MKELLACVILVTSLSTFASGRNVSVFGKGIDSSNYAPLCFGVRGDSKMKAKNNAKEKCAAARGSYKGIEDSDTDCDMDAGGACVCVTKLTIKCEI